MARRLGNKLAVFGAGATAFVAAAAIATGSAAPAKADLEDLLDPIIAPILTSLTDTIALVDSAAALDLTNGTDRVLAALYSLDLAPPAVATPAEPIEAAEAAVTTTYDIPITMEIVTEPTIQTTLAGAEKT